MKIYILLFINIILLVLGQTLWKYGLSNIEFTFTITSIFKVLLNKYIITGIFAYGIATILWLYILSKSELSLVYPLQSICYVIAAFVGLYFFKEHIPATRWIGISFIVFGAYFVAIK